MHPENFLAEICTHPAHSCPHKPFCTLAHSGIKVFSQALLHPCAFRYKGALSSASAPDRIEVIVPSHAPMLILALKCPHKPFCTRTHPRLVPLQALLHTHCLQVLRGPHEPLCTHSPRYDGAFISPFAYVRIPLHMCTSLCICAIARLCACGLLLNISCAITCPSPPSYIEAF